MFILCKIGDKRDDFDSEIVNFPYVDWDVPLSPECIVMFLTNARNKLLTAKLENQGYRYTPQSLF